MAYGDTSKSGFSGTGGYTSGNTVAGNAGGYGNPSSPTGGTGGQTYNSYNSGNWGGGFSGMGYANDAANRAALNAALAQAMDRGAGGALMNQPGAPKPMPKPIPPQIIAQPIPAPVPPPAPVPAPGIPVPSGVFGPALPGWNAQFGQVPTHYSPTGFHPPPNGNYDGFSSPMKDQSRIGPATRGFNNSTQGSTNMGAGFGNGMYGADGNMRGLANGGFAAPGETVMVGERGPEFMQAGLGGAAVTPMMNTMGMGGSPSNDPSAGYNGSTAGGFGALLNAITQRQRQMGGNGANHGFQNPNMPQPGVMLPNYQMGGKGNFGGMGRGPTGGGFQGNLGGYGGEGYGNAVSGGWGGGMNGGSGNYGNNPSGNWGSKSGGTWI